MRRQELHSTRTRSQSSPNYTLATPDFKTHLAVSSTNNLKSALVVSRSLPQLANQAISEVREPHIDQNTNPEAKRIIHVVKTRCILELQRKANE